MRIYLNNKNLMVPNHKNAMALLAVSGNNESFPESLPVFDNNKPHRMETMRWAIYGCPILG